MDSNYNTSKRNFFVRILLPTILTIVLFISVFFFLILPQFENAIMDRKREMIKELTNTAWSILDEWHTAEIEEKVFGDYARQMAALQIQGLRYGDEMRDYFWITDFSPTMIMHPYRPDLNNKHLKGFEDSHGKELFIEMAKIAKRDGEGFVDYMWQSKDDSTIIVPKLSFVKTFKPWGWIIGTGIYIADVQNEITALETRIVNVSIIITILISILLSFIAYQNLSTENLRLRAESELHESREKYRALVEASTEGLIMILEEGQIIYNKTFYTLLGYPDSPTPSLDLADIFPEHPKLKSIDLNTLHINQYDNTFTDKAETIIKKADGTILNVIINASPINLFNSSGVVLSVKDISVNKEIEAELGKSREKYAALTNQLSIGVFRVLFNKDYKFIEANKALMRIFNISDKETLLKTSLKNCFDDESEFTSIIKEVEKNKSVQNRIISISKGDMKLVASVSVVLVKEEKENNLYLDGIIEDVSEQNKSDKVRDNLIYELQTAFLFLNTPVDSFVKPVPYCKSDSTVLEAIKIITDEKSECIIIVDSDDTQIGLLTESDIRKRILTEKENIELPVYNFMSSPLIAVSSNATVYDAISRINEHDIHHLLFKNNEGKISGVILSKDLQKSFHSSYLFFIEKIKESASIADLTTYQSQLILLVKRLIDRQVNVVDITKLITDFSDPIFKRVVQLAINKVGIPPTKFAFIVLGSAGRSEQTLATDQDTAIIFDDIDQEQLEKNTKYFLKLGEVISNDLNQIGYYFCKGGIMAKNPKWCQPISVWKNYFTNWVTTAGPQDLLEVKIFFDFKTIYGDKLLSDQLQDHITRITSGYNSFFVYLSDGTSQFQMHENAVKMKSSFDIKMVMLPFVDCMRLYSLKRKINETNTIERLNQLYMLGVFSKQLYKNLLHSYSFLMQKRFEHQANLISRNQSVDNNINPAEFSDLDIVLFKKSLSVVEDLQNKLKIEFKGTIAI